MAQHFLSRSGLLLACLLVAHATGGCWWMRQPAPERPEPPRSRLAAWRFEKVGVVAFGDATHQAVGGRVAGAFRRELTRRLGEEHIVAVVGGGGDVGLLGVGQAQRLGKAFGVDGLVTGQVLSYAHQRRQARILVTVALRLLDARRGSIIWSRTASGAASIRDSSAPALDAAFDEATTRAAKEFIDDLLAPPPQASAPGHHPSGGRRRAA